MMKLFGFKNGKKPASAQQKAWGQVANKVNNPTEAPKLDFNNKFECQKQLDDLYEKIQHHQKLIDGYRMDVARIMVRMED